MRTQREKIESNINRNEIVDFLRGGATIAVLVGHALQRGLYPANFNEVALTKFIYTWHMQLFVLLAGYTMCSSLQRRGSINLWTKVKRLIIPTYIWSIIVYFIHDFSFVGIKEFRSFEFDFLTYLKILLLQPTYIVWFMWVIFVFTAVVYISHVVLKRFSVNGNLPVLVLSWFAFIGISLVPVNVFGVNYLKQYFGFFLAGYICACMERTELLRLVKVITSVLGVYYLCCKIANSTAIIFPADAKSYLVIGIMYIVICECAKRIKITNKNIVCWFGRNSLYIYLYQFVCLNIGWGTGMIRVITIFCTATTISVLLVLVLNRSAKVRAVLFGEF